MQNQRPIPHLQLLSLFLVLLSPTTASPHTHKPHTHAHKHQTQHAHTTHHPSTTPSPTKSAVNFSHDFITALTVAIIAVVLGTTLICVFAHCWRQILDWGTERRVRNRPRRKRRKDEEAWFCGDRGLPVPGGEEMPVVYARRLREGRTGLPSWCEDEEEGMGIGREVSVLGFLDRV